MYLYLGERDAPRFLVCVRRSSHGERNVEHCPGEKNKQVTKQVLGIRDENARMKVMPPLAVLLLAHEDDMRWNPNDDGVIFNP